MLNAIVAMDNNRVIGKNGKLPWSIPEDLSLFKKTTWGHSIIMGRKTYDSLGRKPLKKRANIVLSRSITNQEGVQTFSCYKELLQELESKKADKEYFIIGGAEIFSLFLSKIQKIYLSLISQNFEGDVFLPPFEADFQKISEQKIQAATPFSFQIWEHK